MGLKDLSRLEKNKQTLMVRPNRTQIKHEVYDISHPSGKTNGPVVKRAQAELTWVEEDDGSQAAELRLIHLHVFHFGH